MLFKGRLFGWRVPIHVAAILRSLRSAVVRILELAFVAAGLVAAGALGAAGLIRRRGLST